jgi:hypothetical protein
LITAGLVGLRAQISSVLLPTSITPIASPSTTNAPHKLTIEPQRVTSSSPPPMTTSAPASSRCP